MELSTFKIIVTGGAQGMGAHFAKRLVEAGAQVAVGDVKEDGLASLAASVTGPGKLHTRKLNVADEAEVVDFVNWAHGAMGGLNGLINNAGILRDGLMLKARDGKIEKRLSLAEWQAVIDVNLTGVFLCGREAATKMIEQGNPGVIINISSVSRAGNMGQTNYSAAKAGVAAMAVTWAKELARYGIRAAAIAPGFIATDMVASMKPEALEKMTAGIPLRRMGTPEEIAHTARFIFENDYITGRVIETDGGIRL